MKGTEGIDYVITECGHCKGSGKCSCYDCYIPIAKMNRNRINKREIEEAGVWGTPNKTTVDYEIDKLKKSQGVVKCSICKGVGKVVFWRK
ncbi:MAG: hypothetical protein K8S18_15635 [Desulfobacula sp.]|nr:hypothetical protein [Desulfobacula sp.]